LETFKLEQLSKNNGISFQVVSVASRVARALMMSPRLYCSTSPFSIDPISVADLKKIVKD